MSSVRPCHNTRNFCGFCNSSIPVPKTSGSSVRLPYPYPESTNPTEHNLGIFITVTGFINHKGCLKSYGAIRRRQGIYHVPSTASRLHHTQTTPWYSYTLLLPCTISPRFFHTHRPLSFCGKSYRKNNVTAEVPPFPPTAPSPPFSSTR